MSCIAGIVSLDGAPVDLELLQQMTATMHCRAPDASGVWNSENVGFGHAMLRMSTGSEKDQQPCTLNGETWLTADARIDGRGELITKLRKAGRQVNEEACDAQLILHSYHAFGDQFIEQLIGDFAFALWDGAKKKLICARDHFGMRPFFYAKLDRFLIFASTIDALLVHPAVSRRLDEHYVADFLLIGSVDDPGISIYRDIRRLLPATVLSLTFGKNLDFNRYWKLPVNQAIRYVDDREYVEEFRDLLKQSVLDRTRNSRVAVEMSGGLDSTSIAALAATANRQSVNDVSAHTMTCKRICPEDQEGYYANIVASHLGIPIHFQEIENYGLFEQYESSQLKIAEPISNPNLLAHHAKLSLVKASGARAMLTGQGGDALFAGSSTYHRNLLYSGKLIRLLAEIRNHWKFSGTLAGMGLRTALFPFLAKQETYQPPFPNWISRDFVRRNDLKDRWDLMWQEWNKHGDGLRQLSYPWLSQVLASYESLKLPVQVRHPLFDVRLVEFVLALPNYMTRRKAILRMAMRDLLPDSVRERPKTPVPCDVLRAKLLSNEGQTQIRLKLETFSEEFIDRQAYDVALEKYLGSEGDGSTWSGQIMITPVALNCWLNYHY